MGHRVPMRVNDRDGSNSEKSDRAQVFRCAPSNGHSSARLARRFSANSGREQTQQHLDYSVTSSARASSVGRAVRPSALAVLRLIKSSMLVGNSTGRSPGLAPFQLKNAPLCGRWGLICPRVHVSALSDRLGSELGVGYLHHRQRPCARRRWPRDPSRSRL